MFSTLCSFLGSLCYYLLTSALQVVVGTYFAHLTIALLQAMNTIPPEIREYAVNSRGVLMATPLIALALLSYNVMPPLNIFLMSFITVYFIYIYSDKVPASARSSSSAPKNTDSQPTPTPATPPPSESSGLPSASSLRELSRRDSSGSPSARSPEDLNRQDSSVTTYDKQLLEELEQKLANQGIDIKLLEKANLFGGCFTSKTPATETPATDNHAISTASEGALPVSSEPLPQYMLDQFHRQSAAAKLDDITPASI